MVEPERDFGVEIAHAEFLKREQADLVAARRRNEGFVANRLEIACLILQAARSAPTASLILRQFEPRFDCLAEKGRADIGAFEFGVRVVRVADAKAHLVEKAVTQFDLATQVEADPRVHLVGYGPSSSTIGANRAGQAAARELTAYLGIGE